MNCLSGAVTSDGMVQVDGAWFPAPPGLKSALAEGQPVVVGVRPEHLTPDAAGSISAQVDAVEWLGHERLVFCHCGDQPLLVRQVGAAADGGAGPVALAVDPAHVHLFDPTTKQRLT
jgi:ABC-type sugar transport system ATPase subunit